VPPTQTSLPLVPPTLVKRPVLSRLWACQAVPSKWATSESSPTAQTSSLAKARTALHGGAVEELHRAAVDEPEV